MCAPGITGVIADFDISSQSVSTLAVTIYLLGLALGPLFLSSLSEMYGRLPVYHGANFVFVAFIIGTAVSKSTAEFMIFRFLSGCAGGMPLALGGGTIADVTPPSERGLATALFSLGPLAGPVSKDADILPRSQLMLIRLSCPGSWSSHRRLPGSQQGLALDILAPGDPRWRRRSSHSRDYARDISENRP